MICVDFLTSNALRELPLATSVPLLSARSNRPPKTLITSVKPSRLLPVSSEKKSDIFFESNYLKPISLPSQNGNQISGFDLVRIGSSVG